MSRSLITRALPVVALSLSALIGGAEKSANAERNLPPLVLTNRTDDCDSIIPNDPGPNCPPCDNCPPDIVPPLYLPARPVQPPQKSPAPTPAEEHPRAAKSPERPVLPPSDPEPEFSKPTEPSSVFSDERAQRLDKLGSLLSELHKRLRDAALPDEPAETGSTAPEFLPTEETPQAESNPPPPELPTPPQTTAPSPDSMAPPAAEPALVNPPPEISVDRSEPVSVAAPDISKPSNAMRDGSIAWIHETAVDSPVDRLALADNLYAAGEAALALNVYAEIDLTSLDSVNRNWVEFQLAGCYRKLGQVEEAATYYRKIVSIEGPAWMVDMARWWLMALDKRAAMTRDSNELDATLQLLEKQVRDEIKPGT